LIKNHSCWADQEYLLVERRTRSQQKVLIGSIELAFNYGVPVHAYKANVSRTDPTEEVI
jgi:hypothetical protein